MQYSLVVCNSKYGTCLCGIQKLLPKQAVQGKHWQLAQLLLALLKRLSLIWRCYWLQIVALQLLSTQLAEALAAVHHAAGELFSKLWLKSLCCRQTEHANALLSC